jgi:hypothetical protein
MIWEGVGSECGTAGNIGDELQQETHHADKGLTKTAMEPTVIGYRTPAFT